MKEILISIAYAVVLIGTLVGTVGLLLLLNVFYPRILIALFIGVFFAVVVGLVHDARRK